MRSVAGPRRSKVRTGQEWGAMHGDPSKRKNGAPGALHNRMGKAFVSTLHTICYA